MKMKLWCSIFGHDFRRKDSTGFTTRYYASEHCRHCGLSKEEIMKLAMGENK